jgi:hypothetical protein
LTDKDGHTTLRLPYATENNGAVVALGPYRISEGDKKQLLTITNFQVQMGETLTLRLY